ncbi:hypothetical protein CONPUDRAFT_141505 [Coniophora puteana RWD-64-598 SS2]|uniref:Uncharacterized protein n=1 Tax=Coniophora puteana (strain RWD-64-598) TaxID=741705 RepID=A0A5M3N7S0_CONPW|nr:uncharacterized protein CONPUDRAFT_141505 [Coniophora puteana RWD-64-598 SS2]EIW87356.1 hypothetical protein CONPUDRAFT_141505 [Coniophora puteana RWD-64-598 SS2]
MSPRPILKQQRAALKQALPPLPSPSPFPFAACRVVDDLSTPHVHFPPTPGIVSGEAITHSASYYDRSSVVVQPNQCAMPGRHARTVEDDPSVQPASPSLSPSLIPFSKERAEERAQSLRMGSYFHPRAFEACEPEPPEPKPEERPFPACADPPTRPPALVPDVGSSSSESDESDGSIFTPPNPPSSPLPASNSKGQRSSLDFLSATLALNCHLHDGSNAAPSKDNIMASPIPRISSQDEIAAAMAFLPHPRPASPLAIRSRHHLSPSHTSSSRSRTPSPTRERRDRTRRSGRTARRKEPPMRMPDAFGLPALDDGCLGGF